MEPRPCGSRHGIAPGSWNYTHSSELPGGTDGRRDGEVVRWLVALLVIALGVVVFVLGVVVFVLGGVDDSPGLQGIGAVLVASATILLIRTVRRDRRWR